LDENDVVTEIKSAEGRADLAEEIMSSVLAQGNQYDCGRTSIWRGPVYSWKHRLAAQKRSGYMDRFGDV
jgi:hypothetical protein